MKKNYAFSRNDLLAVVAVLILLATLAGIPAQRKARERAERISCVGRLKNIGLSYRIFATDNGNLFPWQARTNGTGWFTNRGDAFRHFTIISNELYTPSIARCPADKERREARDFVRFGNENVSYFVGLGASETTPGRLLAGDRNLMVEGVERASEVVTLTTNSLLSWSGRIHKFQGNVAMGDGSVNQCTAERISTINAEGGEANVLLFP